MKKKFFKLFACCIPVQGYCRSIIMDTQRLNYELIPNELFDIISQENPIAIEATIAQFEGADKDTIQSYFDFLIDNEFGFYTDEPYAFPQINTSFVTPKDISNGIIDWSAGSSYSISKAVGLLDTLGAAAIQIRLFDTMERDFIFRLANILHNTNRIRTIELFIKYDASVDIAYIRDIVSSCSALSKIIFHSSPENKHIDEIHDCIVFFVKTKLSDETCCGFISADIFNAEISFVLESMNYNSCLYKKISICKTGEIKNCPALKESYGNIDDSMAFDIRSYLSDPVYIQRANLSKDAVLICKDCEFRYMCTDCRAFTKNSNFNNSKPAKCKYDPYTATWQ